MNISKKLILVASLTGSFILVSNPQETIILWDIHHVILKKTPTTILKRILLYPEKRHMLWNTEGGLVTDFYNLFWQKEKTSEAFIESAHNHGNHKLANMIIDIANTQEPIQGTVAIIKELKEKGYRNHIGSNIGPSVFTDLQKRKPHIFNNDLFELDKSQIASYKNNGILAKPDVMFFKQYFKKNDIDPRTTRIIFIDDKYENIHAAQSVGLIGVHFKNPKQLRHDLIRLGINLKQNNC
ncbi:MAG: hypothetical protein Q8Q25_01430 [bacterium]|nr:hypothetical protein [bacterium]